jgi:SpoVK/Ycf46/Vps4 family AAA+-type ATPase
MIYNEREEDQVLNLNKLLRPDLYDLFVQKAKLNEMCSGLTILLYGAPGTGKTETVMQLARSSNRHLLIVDASAIRSKWIGETEKNLKSVFRQYGKACNQFGHTPILLFNEADAILTRRGVVKERGDHYENAIQNLLLQELEQFEGIFIGTTNLSQNLDLAFQRRILFKIHFEKPSSSIRELLFSNAFPFLSKGECNSLASTYNMTGSEIMNVRRKMAINQVLQENMSGLKIVQTLCIEELSMQPEFINNSIGFRRA